MNVYSLPLLSLRTTKLASVPRSIVPRNIPLKLPGIYRSGYRVGGAIPVLADFLLGKELMNPIMPPILADTNFCDQDTSLG
jgi:hypothetical protein